MLELKDFYLDNLILRQVKRHEAQAAAEMEDDLGEGDDIIVPGTQLNKPRDVNSGAEDQVDNGQKYAVKRGRMSRGPSQARRAATPASEEEEDDPEPIDMDD
jgi:hypothetical protein